ncbi:MAG: Gmad2 immunoglobulin-like domain-containing protein [Chloroflexi bacterium]|nr:Gmad2 immunoglobulin-like domain-containing protein [Chloroflexota bacterium]
MTEMKPIGLIGPAVVIIAAACGAPPSPGSAGVADPTAPAASATATPRPSPLVSTKGSILVKEPASGEQLNAAVVVSGEASVFEANVQYRVVTASGKVLAEGHTTATVGAPQKGTYRVEVSFEAPYYGEAGFVEVFERSAKDGSISDIVRVPVTITGSY